MLGANDVVPAGHRHSEVALNRRALEYRAGRTNTHDCVDGLDWGGKNQLLSLSFTPTPPPSATDAGRTREKKGADITWWRCIISPAAQCLTGSAVLLRRTARV